MLDRLTFSRLFAALAVVFFHFGQQIWPLNVAPWSQVLRAGPDAVSYFFVLSGFIMTIVYAELSPRGAPAYWLARFARIYPVYMLGLFLFVWVTGTWNWKAVGLNLLLLQAWVPRFALSGNSVGWSLSVEAWFYLLFPTLIGLSRRIGPARWTALVAACWVVTQVWVSWMVEVHYTGFPSAIHDLIFYFPPGHLSTFLVGMTAAMFVRGTAWRPPAGQALALGAAATAFVVYFL
ncbi:MAG TPA: acyltransferase, partial [Acetobacteraceae bacterium]